MKTPRRGGVEVIAVLVGQQDQPQSRDIPGFCQGLVGHAAVNEDFIIDNYRVPRGPGGQDIIRHLTVPVQSHPAFPVRRVLLQHPE